jgi:hypothetical protein
MSGILERIACVKYKFKKLAFFASAPKNIAHFKNVK